MSYKCPYCGNTVTKGSKERAFCQNCMKFFSPKENTMKDEQIEAQIDKLMEEESSLPSFAENGFSFTVTQEQGEADVTLELTSPEGRVLIKKVGEKDGYTLLNKLWDATIAEFNKA